MKILILLLFLCFSCKLLIANNFKGTIVDVATKKPIAYVNIGVLNKNTGTVSDEKGEFKIEIDDKFIDDTIVISRIGYNSLKYSVCNFIQEYKDCEEIKISMSEKLYDLKEVMITPKNYKNKRLGNFSNSKLLVFSLRNKGLGCELGTILKVKKTALLEKLYLNIGYCSYDTVFYRINLYKVISKNNFEPILSKPMYNKLLKSEKPEVICIDLSNENICLYGNTLITLEFFKGLGEGQIDIAINIGGKSYFRPTSQGKWENIPISVGISVDAKVEK
jgi:hypothetical protein